MRDYDALRVTEIPSARWDIAVEQLQRGGTTIVLEDDVRVGLQRDIWSGGSGVRVYVWTDFEPSKVTPKIVKADAQRALAMLGRAVAADARLGEIMSHGDVVYEYLYDYGMGSLALTLFDANGKIKRMLLGMGGDFNPEWIGTVRRLCDPVFEAADVNFIAQVQGSDAGPALLWEADPEQFATRYPDSEIVGSYGSSWPPPCIDYWVYVDAEQRRAQLSPEGWNLSRIDIDLSGDGHRDGVAIAREFARILRVPGPPGDV